MSLKRSSSTSRGSFGSSDPGAKVNRQGLFDHLKRLGQNGSMFSPVDIALVIGAGEPQVARALLGLTAEGCLEKADGGKYKVAPGFDQLSIAEFLKAYTRASKADSSRQQNLSDITRLKLNNDIMRGRLLQAVAERDHYLAALKQHGIDPGPAPVPVVAAAATADSAAGGAESATAEEEFAAADEPTAPGGNGPS